MHTNRRWYTLATAFVVVWLVVNSFSFSETTPEGCPADAPAPIEDTNLYAWIRIALGKESDEIVTCTDLLSLESVSSAIRDGIKSLEGLQYAIHLTYLRIPENSISDLTPLTNLTKIHTLRLWGNQISDVTPLANLAELTELVLYENAITDISPLAGLTKLETLHLMRNQISDLTPLVGLTGLRELYLAENAITDPTGIESLVNLEKLTLSGNDVTTLEPLRNLRQLSYLSLGMRVHDDEQLLSPVMRDPPPGSAHRVISPVRQLDTTPLHGLTALETLIVNSIKLTELSFLSEFKNLRDLGLVNVGLRGSDLGPIAPFSLRSLQINDNQIDDLTLLANAPDFNSRYIFDVHNNCLDLTPGSRDMQDLQVFIDRGLPIYVGQQKDCTAAPRD
jgi:Leucine-rich repeat (LRR) protein